MSGRGFSAAVVLALCLGAPALADLRGPAELPPAGFKSQQYVDSRGCVFLRAGYGGNETWVPRVNRNRTQLCAAPASGRPVAAAPAPAPAPKAEPVIALPAAGLRAAPAAPKAVPAPPRVAAIPAPQPVVTVAPKPRVVVAAPALGPAPAAKAERRAKLSADAIPTPPPGYKLAWEDDRLNPNRGKQTVQGVLDQDRIWTRHTPAVLRADGDGTKAPLTIMVRKSDGSLHERQGIVVSTKGDGRRVVKLLPEAGVSKSSKGVAATSAAPKAKSAAAPAPAPAATKTALAKGGQRLFVQVGAFGQAQNAEGTAGRLQSLGLPVARGKAGALQVIYAGPFASDAAAKSALAAVHSAGFRDALILR